MSDDTHTTSWEHVFEYHPQPDTSVAEMMREDGLELLSAETLSDEALHERLWALIRYLARRSIYLIFTDHLSDRQLYVYLSEEFAQETIWDFGAMGGWYTIDLVGSGSDEDIETYLRHFANHKTRVSWARDGLWDGPLPQMEPPPFDRDRHLPRRSQSLCFVEYDSRKRLRGLTIRG